MFLICEWIISLQGQNLSLLHKKSPKVNKICPQPSMLWMFDMINICVSLTAHTLTSKSQALGVE